MIQFFETGYGKRFFDGQLPNLIRALEKIADRLPGNVLQDGVDYEMPNDLKNTWVSVKDFSVNIRTSNDGVVVAIYNKGKEDEASLGTLALDKE